MYVAELPPKYNLQTVVEEGCSEGRYLETLLSNPLGTLLSNSLDSALYRCKVLLAEQDKPACSCDPGAGTKTLPASTHKRAQRRRVARRNSSALSLEVHMHMQMLYSPLRVLTVEEADVVYALLLPISSALAVLPSLQKHVC